MSSSSTLIYGCNLTLKLNHTGECHFASFQAGLNNRPLAETSLLEEITLFTFRSSRGPGEAGTPERGCS